MSLGKLTRQQVAIIGSILIVIVIAGVYFGLIRKQIEDYAAAQSKYNSNHEIAVTRPAAEADRAKANQEGRRCRGYSGCRRSWRSSRAMPR